MTRRILIGAAAVCILVSSCGGSDSDTETNTTEASAAAVTATTGGATVTPTLADAEEVRSDELAGEPAEMGAETTDGHVIAVASNPRVGGDDAGPWMEIDLRIENSTDEAVQFYNTGIVCSGNDEVSGTVIGGTLDGIGGLPPQSFDEGSQFVLLPGDGRYGEPIPPCQAPAVLRIEVIGEDGFVPDVALTWAIPDEIIAEMNAAIS
jgi:hypothetical protein